MLHMRLRSQRRHHGDDMKKKHDIANEWVRYILAKIDFEVSPEPLVYQPQTHAHAQQRPEDTRSAVSCTRIRQQHEKAAQEQQ